MALKDQPVLGGSGAEWQTLSLPLFPLSVNSNRLDLASHDSGTTQEVPWGALRRHAA